MRVQHHYIRRQSVNNRLPVFIPRASAFPAQAAGASALTAASFDIASYFREGDTSVTEITLQSANSIGSAITPGSAFVAGAICELTALTSTQKGVYEFHLPDAVVAHGASWATVSLIGGTDAQDVFLHIDIIRSIAI